MSIKGINCFDCNLKSPLFRFLSEKELETINKAKTQVSFKAGEIIVKQGAPLSHVISFASGLAKVFIEGQHNMELILKFICPTEFIGSPGIYTDKKHHFSVSSIEDSVVCFIEVEAFRNLIRHNLKFAEAFIQHISLNGIFNYDRFISLTHKNINGRLADTLIYLSKSVFHTRGGEITISNENLADFTGMSKDSVGRTLKGFQSDNLISTKGKKILILDNERLLKISLFS